MTKQEAIASIGKEVFWPPVPVPLAVVPKTELGKGALTEVTEIITADGTVLLATAGFATHKVGDLCASFADAKAALKARYTTMKAEAQSDVVLYDELATDCDQIGVFPEPEPEPIPIG